MVDTARELEAFTRASEARTFLDRALEAAANPASVGFRAFYAGVSRRLGSSAAQSVTPPPAFAALARPHHTLTDWVRATLVVHALGHLSLAEQPAFVLRLLEGGEIGEQESLLRTLSLLPEPARFVETGLAACRTNARRVFEAIACENPFPAEHFPALGFQQMVLKAVFIEVAVARIEGLDARRTPELVRMAEDYASERRAAGRPVPDDLALIAGR
ncbi:MAG TPA: EboA domain-containing protein [Polyangiaceae bacterium]